MSLYGRRYGSTRDTLGDMIELRYKSSKNLKLGLTVLGVQDLLLGSVPDDGHTMMIIHEKFD